MRARKHLRLRWSLSLSPPIAAEPWRDVLQRDSLLLNVHVLDMIDHPRPEVWHQCFSGCQCPRQGSLRAKAILLCDPDGIHPFVAELGDWSVLGLSPSAYRGEPVKVSMKCLTLSSRPNQQVQLVHLATDHEHDLLYGSNHGSTSVVVMLQELAAENRLSTARVLACGCGPMMKR